MSKYISLENLERYDAKMQERAASFCASKEDGMWRQTEKAGAVQFWPVGNSPLEGAVEFMFKETGPASGTKSPDNPSTISGVSSIGLTVCQEEGVDEHSYSFSLGGTYYGGSIDLATGLMTVTQFGEEFGVISSSGVFVGTVQTNTVSFDVACNNRNKGNTSKGIHVSNRFIFGQNNDDHEHFRVTGNVATGSLMLRFFIEKTRLDVSGAINPASPTDTEWIQAFLAWVSNNNIFVVCDLFAPQTLQLTPPQIRALAQHDKYVPRLNTVYSDADAVQIVYQKNPVRDKFEKVQAIIAQGGNV